MAEINNTMTAHSGEDMEQEEHFSIVCGSAKLVNHSENQYGNSSKIRNYSSSILSYTYLGPIHKDNLLYTKGSFSTNCLC